METPLGPTYILYCYMDHFGEVLGGFPKRSWILLLQVEQQRAGPILMRFQSQELHSLIVKQISHSMYCGWIPLAGTKGAAGVHSGMARRFEPLFRSPRNTSPISSRL